METDHKNIPDSINIFFTDLKYILELSNKNKKETDLYLASDFNVFDYIHDYENIISDIISHMLDPKGKHGQGSLFLEKFGLRDGLRDVP